MPPRLSTPPRAAPALRSAVPALEPAGRRVLDSVVEITAEQDRERFRASFRETVGELLQVEQLAFVRVVAGPDGQPTFEDLPDGSAPAAMPASATIRPHHVEALLRSGEHLTVGGDTTTLLLPVLHRETLIEVVVVRAPALPTAALYMLRAFARLYRNFLALIMTSERDALTGLYNRRTLETRLADVARGVRDRRSLMRPCGDERRGRDGVLSHFVAMLDIDHFKRINDSLGHLFGDEVLLLVSQLMREVFRDDDMLFRYGGEEFVVVLACCTREGARAALERFRETIAAHRFPQLDRVTVSIGMAEMRPLELPGGAIARADQALYCSKEDGRDRVSDYDERIAAGRIRREAVEDDVELF